MLGAESETVAAILSLVPEHCSVTSLGYDTEDLNAYDIVWMHKADTSEFSQELLALRNAVLGYVEKGGSLLLTMDAVNLPDLWQVDVSNESRWKINPDNRVSRVFSYGKGRILLLVAYIGEDDPGMGSLDIKMLMKNGMSVLKGQIDSAAALPADSISAVLSADMLSAHHQGCEHTGCRVCAAEYKHVKIAPPVSWNTVTAGRTYRPASDVKVSITSDRLTVYADEKYGINEVRLDETVKAISDYRVFLDIDGYGQIVPLADYSSAVACEPGLIARRYDIDGKILSETIAVSDSLRRVMVVHYEWDDLPLRQMIVDYRSDLALAWPFENMTSSLYHLYSLELNAGVVRDSFKETASIVGSDISGRNLENGRYSSFTYDDWKIAGVAADDVCVGVSTIYSVRKIHQLDIVMAATDDGIDELLHEYAYVLNFPENVRDVLKNI